MADDSDEERQKRQVHQNQPYDESLDVPDAEEVASLYTPTPRVPQPRPAARATRMSEPERDEGVESPELSDTSDEDYNDEPQDDSGAMSEAPAPGPPPRQSGAAMGQTLAPLKQAEPPSGEVTRERGRGPGVSPSAMSENSDDEFVTGAPGPPQGLQRGLAVPSKPVPGQLEGMSQGPPKGQGQIYGGDDDDDDDEEGSESTDDDDDEGSGEAVEGAYDPADYDHLAVSKDIKELFQYITRYTPQSIELDYKMKPFIPDFIPSVGDIDAFIKVRPPDNSAESLGLTVLDEPCAKQSDPTVLDLHLRAVNRQHTVKAVAVKSIGNVEKTPKAIDNWIESISELHRTKPAPNVHYTKNMPDIDTLMQEWPPEFEELLKEVSLPTADLDCDLATYVDISCSLVDIPVYKSRIQSLHVLFTLFSEFKNSQHFRSLAEENKMDNAVSGAYGEDSDRLVI